MTTRPDPRAEPKAEAAARPVVVKLGGSTLGAHDTSLVDIAAWHGQGRRIVVVHGGGATVNAWLERAGLKPKFVRGLRVTDEATLEVAVAVLCGLINKQIVADLTGVGAKAVGFSGADGGIVRARRYDEELGRVGRIERVDPAPIEDLLRAGYLPVIAPVAADTAGGLLNTNADTASGEIAAALRAERLVFLTDVEGVLDAGMQLQEHLTRSQAVALIAEGVAGGGMIPKLEAAVRAAAAGCATRIVDGTSEGALARVLAGGAGGTTVG